MALAQVSKYMASRYLTRSREREDQHMAEGFRLRSAKRRDIAAAHASCSLDILMSTGQCREPHSEVPATVYKSPASPGGKLPIQLSSRFHER